MNCHHVAVRDSELLEPIRKSIEQDRPMRWVRIHNLPTTLLRPQAFMSGPVSAAGPATVPVHEMEVVSPGGASEHELVP